MNTKELLNRLEGISAEITALYAELAGELPDLRIVVDNTRPAYNSEVKKMPGNLSCSREARWKAQKIRLLKNYIQ